MRLWLSLVLLVSFPSIALAQTCRKGKPCGNTCIAQNRECHVGSGTARATPQSTRAATPRTSTAADAYHAPASPADSTAYWVASTKGHVYYRRDCQAAQRLAVANRRYFHNISEAEAAGYRRSKSEDC